MIRESEPPRPSSRVMPATEAARQSATSRGTEPAKLTRTLRGDLDWITLKALEKERERRYESAAAMAQDLERHLKNEPVNAGPPSAFYRLRKMMRRNRLAVGAAVAIAMSLIAGTAVSTWQAIRATRAEGVAKAVNDFLQDDLLSQAGSNAQANRRERPNANLTVREALDRASASIERRFRDQPLAEAAIRDTIGRTYNDLGDGGKAQPHLVRAIKLRSELLGTEHRETLRSRTNLAMALDDLSMNEKAEKELQAVIAIQQRVLGPGDLDTLSSRNNLAIVLHGQGKHAAAEQEFRAVVVGKERLLGQGHPATLSGRNNLATLLESQGKLDEAELEFRELTAIRKRVLGPSHPDTLILPRIMNWEN